MAGCGGLEKRGPLGLAYCLGALSESQKLHVQTLRMLILWVHAHCLSWEHQQMLGKWSTLEFFPLAAFHLICSRHAVPPVQANHVEDSHGGEPQPLCLEPGTLTLSVTLSEATVAVLAVIRPPLISSVCVTPAVKSSHRTLRETISKCWVTRVD